MLDVVVDTNVLIRALLKPDSSDGKIIRKVVTRDLNLAVSQELLDELVRVLEYPRFKKFDVTQQSISSFLNTLVTFGDFIIPKETNLCRDKDDNIILGIALALVDNDKVYLISADKDLLVLKGKVEGITIMTPQEFLKLVKS